jgi:hypothetical protein
VLHADQAVNSIYDAAGALLGLPLYGNSASDVMKWIDGGLQRDPTGRSLGLAFEHPEMGHTWVSPVGFDRVGEEVTVLVDVRWPLGHDAAWIRQRFAAAIQEWNAKNGTKLSLGWEPGGLDPVETVPPAPVREALDEAHALATGEGATPGRAAPTCARALPDAIPFGPESARGGSQAHTRDESISRRELQDHGVASLAALVVLATRPLPSP